MADGGLSVAAIGILAALWESGKHNAIHAGMEKAYEELNAAMERRTQQKMTNRAMAAWVQSFAYVHFDFSDWTWQQLNPSTTSNVWGISRGTLTVKTDAGERTISCDGTFDTFTGKDIVWLYRFCLENGPSGSTAQRRFRFENGKYAGEGPVKTLFKVGGAAVAVGGLVAWLFN